MEGLVEPLSAVGSKAVGPLWRDQQVPVAERVEGDKTLARELAVGVCG